MRVKVIRAKQKAPQKLRVCAYVRVSAKSPELEDSFEAQRQHYLEYISLNPQWTFAGIYSDDGISGFSNERPGFLKMMEDARAGRFDLILVKSISRFARNTETLLRATRELKNLGIGVLFELQNINTLTQAGELMMTVKAAFAQGESDSDSSLIKMAYTQKFSQGIPTAASAKTYGFKRGEGNEILVDEDQAQVVQLIFDLADQGVTGARIAHELNRREIPSPGGAKWQSSQVMRMVHNVMYKGDLILQKYFSDANHKSHKNFGEAQSWYVTNNHTPIISREQWERVQERTRGSNGKADNLPVEKHSSHSTYPLSGLLFCPYCGAVLHHKWGSKCRYEYWACSVNIKKGAHVCKGLFVPARITQDWKLNEPVVVIPYKDAFGMQQFTAMPKEEYEGMKGEIS